MCGFPYRKIVAAFPDSDKERSFLGLCPPRSLGPALRGAFAEKTAQRARRSGKVKAKNTTWIMMTAVLEAERELPPMKSLQDLVVVEV